MALCTCACLAREEYSQEDIDALINKEVEKRIQDYIRIRNERCMEDLLREAGRLADSIMVVEAFFDRDTLLRPPKAEKPERPELKKLEDTTPVKPLFERKKEKEMPPDSIRKN